MLKCQMDSGLHVPIFLIKIICIYRNPKSLVVKRDVDPVQGVNMSQYELPDNIDQQYNKLLQQFLDGELLQELILL